MADLKARAEPLPIGSDGNKIKIEHREVIHKVRFAKATLGGSPEGTTKRVKTLFNLSALSLKAQATIEEPE